jgi:ISXO2 transposase-like protein/transposase-like zinc ribbon protein
MKPTYQRLKAPEFYERIKTEEQARDWIWKSRFGGKDFVCSRCGEESFYQYINEPEIRKCRACHHLMRLRVGTIFEASKTSLLTWLRAIYWAMQGKRGISALELKRQLKMKSYGTTWTMLHKIRRALRCRDDRYKLKEIVELDGAKFGKREAKDHAGVFVAVETKDWVDEQGRTKSKAGFAKVMVKPETTIYAKQFVSETLEPGTLINTDGAHCYEKIPEADSQVMNQDKAVLDRWLPWVHKFISNAKAWLLGTHHRATTKYLQSYLAEYTYRFNRRHDLDSLFHRALTACAMGSPCTAGSLFG